MVAAINHVFSTAEVRPGGAFRFQEADVNHTAENELPFSVSVPAGEVNALFAQAVFPPQLPFGRFPLRKGLKRFQKHYQEAMALACAHEIVSLLNAGDAGEAGFLSSQENLSRYTLAILLYW